MTAQLTERLEEELKEFNVVINHLRKKRAAICLLLNVPDPDLFLTIGNVFQFDTKKAVKGESLER